jgi:hypothetical protein
MNFEEHFLPHDISQASKEYRCVLDLAQRTVEALNNGNFLATKRLSEDLSKSAGQLVEMSTKKYNQDKFYTAVQELAQRKIKAKAVERRLHER